MNALAVLVRREVQRSPFRQADIAFDVGVSQKHLSQMLNGRVQMSITYAELILAAVGRRLVLATAPLDSSRGK